MRGGGCSFLCQGIEVVQGCIGVAYVVWRVFLVCLGVVLVLYSY